MNIILQILKDNKQFLFEKYPLKSLALFESYSRGDYTTESDVDIMVDFSKPIGIKFLDLCYDIEALIKKEVDLVSRKAIKPKQYLFIQQDLKYV